MTDAEREGLSQNGMGFIRPNGLNATPADGGYGPGWLDALRP
jgi:hypothetical protein